MMRRQSCTHTLIQVLILATLVLISYPSQAESEHTWDTNRSKWVAQPATPAVRVRVTITKTKPKLLLAKSHRPLAKLFLDDQDNDYYDDQPDLQVGYRRPELVDTVGEVVDLNDNIKIRLALARLKAIKKYEETWS